MPTGTARARWPSSRRWCPAADGRAEAGTPRVPKAPALYVVLDRCEPVHATRVRADIGLVGRPLQVAAERGEIVEIGDHGEIVVVGAAADIHAAGKRPHLGDVRE